MTVEEKGSVGREEGPGDQFPIGMRVLAVDDDPICLKLLEALLLRCQYHVTTTNQAIKALNMLRDNKDKFDLVISDVHMPDMDGFKLLEHVGLEMDLPVIMLSANGETKAVMKGITHGACDYLLKPVRIEELRNIWQHVVRRRRFDHKEHYYLDHGEDYEKSQAVNSEGTQGAGANGASDHIGKVNRKSKDQNDEDEDDCDENNNEGEDPSTQKKARVVWSVDLHRKFVAAVNQMGIDKAVPKRILDLMNVDKLTRENVASHLQKYRLYLKRLSAVASQQANMAAALGGRDASNLHLGTLNGFANYGISPSGQLQGLTPFRPCGLSNRMNPNFLGLPGLAPGAVQISHIQSNTNNHMNDLSKFQQIAVPANQHENLLQGIPTSLERDQLQQKQIRIHETNNLVPGVLPGASCNTFISAMDTSLLLQGHQQQTQLGGFGNQSSVAIPSIKADRLEMSCALSSHLPVISRSNETLETAPSLSTYNSNILPIRVPYSNNNLASSNMGATITSTVPQLNGNPLNISSDNLLFTGKDSLIGRDMQNQTSLHGENTLLMPSGIDSDSKYVNFRSVGSLGKNLKEPKLQNAHEPNITYSSSLNSTLTNQILQNTVPNTQRLQNRIYDKMVDTRMMGQPSLDTAFIIQPFRTDKSIVNNRHIFNEESMLGTSKMHGGFASNGCNFDELMNAIIKPERDDIGFVEGEICSDLFPLSTCM